MQQCLGTSVRRIHKLIHRKIKQGPFLSISIQQKAWCDKNWKVEYPVCILKYLTLLLHIIFCGNQGSAEALATSNYAQT